MSPKSFAVLALATVASVALAVHAVGQRDLPIQAEAVAGPMFPGLLDRVNDVREVHIVGPDGILTVVQKDQGWALQEKSGYPVDPEQLRKLVLGVANLQLVEAKTADPARLGRLDLQEPGSEAAKSRLVELKGADGRTLAAAVIGKTTPSLYGTSHGGIYVRRGGENQSWLASGTLDVPGDALMLLGGEVVDVPVEQVAQVVLRAPDGSALTLSRPDAAAEFTVDVPLPEGRKLDPAKVEFVTAALTALRMTDVQPASALPPEAERRQARFQTFDGLPIEVTLATVGEGENAKHWLTFRADPPASADPAPAKPALLDKVRGLEAWAYEVPSYLADRFKGGLDSLLAEPTPAS